MAKLSTGQIKSMFAKFFSTPKFDENFFSYWMTGGGGEKNEAAIKEACDQLQLDMLKNPTPADIIAAARAAYVDPANWKRTSKGTINKFEDVENPFESGKIEDFEETCGELGNVEDVDLFNAQIPTKGAKCIIRSFYFQPKKFTDYFGSEDVEILVVTDPTDSAVIGWFFHID